MNKILLYTSLLIIFAFVTDSFLRMKVDLSVESDNCTPSIKYVLKGMNENNAAKIDTVLVNKCTESRSVFDTTKELSHSFLVAIKERIEK